MAQLAQPPSRTRRRKRRSNKALEALEAGEQIPGLAPSTSPSVSPSPLRAQDAIRATQRPSSTKVVGPAHSFTMPNRSKAASQHPQQQPQFHGSSGTMIPAFGDDFVVYFWPHPKPKDFTQLDQAQRRWKDGTDKNDPFLFLDSELADDWSDISGNPSANDTDPRKANAREYAIARTFVSRAKRAYVAGKSWTQFEAEEDSIDSEEVAHNEARMETNIERRDVILEEAVNNGLRLAVFNQLKARLCNEVWSHTYRRRQSVDLEVVKKADERRKAFKEEVERTVERWELKTGLDMKDHPLPIFKADTAG